KQMKLYGIIMKTIHWGIPVKMTVKTKLPHFLIMVDLLTCLHPAAAAAQPPDIASFSLSGANLVLNSINGQSTGTYYVLTSTNFSLPLSQWARVATNVLGASGNFTITVTNTFTPSTPERFYMLELQSQSTATSDGMAFIPAGEFTMGDTLDGESDAIPTNVYVSAF